MVNATVYEGGEDGKLPIDMLPKTALQAIYHAATGKTESLSKDLNENVIVRSGDIDRLHGMIIDQLGHYDVHFGPTVTIVIKCSNEKSITYSSWERFQAIRVDNHDLTSDITLKYEFVILLPNTPQPQRCVISVNVDSSLPVIKSQREDSEAAESLGFIFVMNQKWRTIRINVDFVDYLIAKIFSSVVEDWFSKLKPTPNQPFNRTLLKNYQVIRTVMGQFGRIGMGVFIATDIFLNRRHSFRIRDFALLFSIGIIGWALFIIVETSFVRKVFKRISANVIPSVILLNDEDDQVYKDICESTNSPFGTIFQVASAMTCSVLLNIIASYIYSYLTRN